MIEELSMEILAIAGAGFLAYLSGLTTFVIRNYKKTDKINTEVQSIMQLLYGFQQSEDTKTEGHIQRTDDKFDELIELSKENNKKINSLITTLDQEDVVDYDDVQNNYEMLKDD